MHLRGGGSTAATAVEATLEALSFAGRARRAPRFPAEPGTHLHSGAPADPTEVRSRASGPSAPATCSALLVQRLVAATASPGLPCSGGRSRSTAGIAIGPDQCDDRTDRQADRHFRPRWQGVPALLADGLPIALGVIPSSSSSRFRVELGPRPGANRRSLGRRKRRRAGLLRRQRRRDGR